MKSKENRQKYAGQYSELPLTPNTPTHTELLAAVRSGGRSVTVLPVLFKHLAFN